MSKRNRDYLSTTEQEGRGSSSSSRIKLKSRLAEEKVASRFFKVYWQNGEVDSGGNGDDNGGRLGLAILVPNQFKEEEGGGGGGEGKGKGEEVVKFESKVRFKVWLIRLKVEDKEDKGEEEEFIKLDRWELSVAYSKLKEIWLSTGRTVPVDPIDKLNWLITVGFQFIWSPNSYSIEEGESPLLYLIYNRKFIKLLGLTESDRTKLNNNITNTPITNIGSDSKNLGSTDTVNLRSTPSTMTILELEVKNGHFQLSHIGTLRPSNTTTTIDSTSLLPYRLFWCEEPTSYHELRTHSYRNLFQPLHHPSTTTTTRPPPPSISGSRSLYSLTPELRKFLPIPELVDRTPEVTKRTQCHLQLLKHFGVGEVNSDVYRDRRVLYRRWWILGVELGSGEVELCVQGRYHMGTIPHQETLKSLPTSEDGTWKNETSVSIDLFAPYPNSTFPYLPYRTPELTLITWFHRTITGILKELDRDFDKFKGDLEQHLNSFPDQMKYFPNPILPSSADHPSPMDPLRLLRNFMLFGIPDPRLLTFLDFTELEKFKGWRSDYTTNYRRLSDHFEFKILFQLKRLLSVLGQLKILMKRIDSFDLTHLITTIALYYHLSTTSFLTLLHTDHHQFHHFITWLIQYIESRNPHHLTTPTTTTTLTPLPSPNNDAIRYLTRMKLDRPTPDLISFFRIPPLTTTTTTQTTTSRITTTQTNSILTLHRQLLITFHNLNLPSLPHSLLP